MHPHKFYIKIQTKTLQVKAKIKIFYTKAKHAEFWKPRRGSLGANLKKILKIRRQIILFQSIQAYKLNF